jgi:WD40 repeat protein
MEKSDIFICDECEKYFDKPILLPCGNSMCEHHVDISKKSYNCKLCDQEHQIPENGFAINKRIHRMINVNWHLSGKQKFAKKIYDEIASLLIDYELNQLVDPNNYIFEYFANIRKQIDLHYEFLIENIKNKHLALIEDLKNEEKNCLDKAKKLQINIDKKDLSDWREQLQIPNIEESKLNFLINKFENTINIIKNEIQSYKLDLIDNKTFEFQSDDSLKFGNLIINDGTNIKKINNNFVMCLKTFTGHSMPITSLAKKGNDEFISASEDKSIKIWRLNDNSCVTTLYGHQNCVSSIALISYDTLVSGSWDFSIKIWDLKNQNCIKSINEDSEITSICVLNKHIFAVGQLSGLVNLYDSFSFEKKISFKAHCTFVSCLKSKSVIKSTFASSSIKGSIKLWALSDDKSLSKISIKCTQNFLGHKDRVFCLEFYDIYLISGSDDRTIKIWHINSCQIKKSIDVSGKIFCLKHLNFGKKNIKLIIGTNDIDATIQIYNFNNNETAIVKKLTGHSRYVVDFLFFPKLRSLVSASGDGTIKIWNIEQD